MTLKQRRILILKTTDWPMVAVVSDDLLAGPDPGDGVNGSLAPLTWDRQGAQVAWREFLTPFGPFLGIGVAPVVTDTAGHPTVLWSDFWLIAQEARNPAPRSLSFSPDGSAIAFVAFSDNRHFGYQYIFRINTDGSGRKRIDGQGRRETSSAPDWGP